MRSARFGAIVIALVLVLTACGSSSKAAGEIVVPNLVGMSAHDAKAGLVRLGFTVGTPKTTKSAKPGGTVVTQSVAPGEKAVAGDVITLTVSVRPQAKPPPKAPTPTTVAASPAVDCTEPEHPHTGALTPEEIAHMYNVGIGKCP